jgi:molybdate transport system regulatory protein
VTFAELVPRVSVTLVHHGVPVLGDREARLLEAVERVRSLKEAARATGISYRTAWGSIQLMQEALGRPIVESHAGGPGGGVSTLTDECRQLLQVYREMRQRLEGEVARQGATVSVYPDGPRRL